MNIKRGTDHGYSNNCGNNESHILAGNRKVGMIVVTET
jgi:hypothetical protein